MDPAFGSPGGGFVNLDFFARACARPETTLFVTPGEGTFHQFHGGVTTGGLRGEERARFMRGIEAEYRVLRGRDFAMPRRDAIYLGRIHPSARRLVRESIRAWGPSPDVSVAAVPGARDASSTS